MNTKDEETIKNDLKDKHNLSLNELVTGGKRNRKVEVDDSWDI
ncbi:hypothetical protein UT300012_22840 [Paraclostridium bifermentans]